MNQLSNAVKTIRQMRSYRTSMLVALGIATVIVTVLAASSGALKLSFMETLAILLDGIGITGAHPIDESHKAVVWSIRLPRVLLALMVGAILSVSGAVMQGLFRNPLAEPGLIGVSSGAALAAAIMIVLGDPLLATLPEAIRPLMLPAAAFIGASMCTYLVYAVSLHEGRLSVTTMLLAGIAFNAIGFSALGMLQYLADDNELRGLTFWMMGSLGGATWDTVQLIGVIACITLTGSILLARPLNCFLLGSAEAAHLGVSVERITRISIILVALGVGATVAMSGMIGFLGLVVPHIIRLAVSPDHRIVIPGAALLGACLLVGADTFARLIVVPSELPVGIVTTLFGSPFFLFLLIKAKQ